MQESKRVVQLSWPEGQYLGYVMMSGARPEVNEQAVIRAAGRGIRCRPDGRHWLCCAAVSCRISSTHTRQGTNCCALPVGQRLSCTHVRHVPSLGTHPLQPSCTGCTRWHQRQSVNLYRGVHVETNRQTPPPLSFAFAGPHIFPRRHSHGGGV